MHKIDFCSKVPMPRIIRWMTVLVWYLPESVSEEGLIQSSPFAERFLCMCVQLFIVDILCICLLWIALHCGRASVYCGRLQFYQSGKVFSTHIPWPAEWFLSRNQCHRCCTSLQHSQFCSLLSSQFLCPMAHCSLFISTANHMILKMISCVSRKVSYQLWCFRTHSKFLVKKKGQILFLMRALLPVLAW